MSTYDIKISNSEWQSIYISAIFAVVGYVAAMLLCDPIMFARFGSFIVCIGVIFSINRLPQILDSVQPIYSAQLQVLRGRIESMCSGHEHEGEIRAVMEEQVLPKIDEVEKKMNRTIFALKKRLLQIEGGVIIIGTLIWGFGDCLVLKLASCPANA